MKKIILYMFAALSVCFYACGKDGDSYNSDIAPHRKNGDSTAVSTTYPKAQGSLRFVQYNVGVFSKYQTNSIPDVANILKELDADAVSLNELDSCNTRHNTYQLRDLVTALGGGWNYYYLSTIDNRGGRYGIGAITLADISAKWGGFPPKTAQEQRGLCVVETSKYVLASTHLNWVDPTVSSAEAAWITQKMMEKYASDKRLVVLMGDFNARPNTQTITVMKKSWTIVSTTAFSTTVNDQMFDYVFVLNNGVKYSVTNTNVATSIVSANVKTASDHFPIFADIKF